jgi:hypothetical protein
MSSRPNPYPCESCFQLASEVETATVYEKLSLMTPGSKGKSNLPRVDRAKTALRRHIWNMHRQSLTVSRLVTLTVLHNAYRSLIAELYDEGKVKVGP